jgi:hypothetical protein
LDLIKANQSILIMKSLKKQLVRGVGFAFLFLVSFSCSQKSETLEDRKIDSVSIQPPAAENFGSNWGDSVHSNNAVRVQLDSSRTFDWNAFRQKFHDSHNSSGDFPDEVAVGPWVSWNEYEYQRVYNYVNDALWIQTFYRTKDSTDSNQAEATVLLDSQNPDYVQFGPLWSDMLTRGHHLTDSLK